MEKRNGKGMYVLKRKKDSRSSLGSTYLTERYKNCFYFSGKGSDAQLFSTKEEAKAFLEKYESIKNDFVIIRAETALKEKPFIIKVKDYENKFVRNKTIKKHISYAPFAYAAKKFETEKKALKYIEGTLSKFENKDIFEVKYIEN